MKVYTTTTVFAHPWDKVSLAIYNKYPNPFASHVLSADVIERSVDSNGVISTTRLFLKKNKIPEWGLRVFPANPVSQGARGVYTRDIRGRPTHQNHGNTHPQPVFAENNARGRNTNHTTARRQDADRDKCPVHFKHVLLLCAIAN